MTSIRFHFRPSVRMSEEPSAGILYLRVIHCRKSLTVTTPYRIYPGEWSSRHHLLVLPFSTDSPRLRYLLDTEELMNRDLRRINGIIERLQQDGEFTVQELVACIRNRSTDNQLSVFVRQLSAVLCDRHQERTARAYRTAAACLIRFNRGTELRLEQLNATLILNFERWLKENGKSMNTISFYMRNLRAIYNKAIAAQRIQPCLEHPFTRVYTGVYPTRKRALSEVDINLLANLGQTDKLAVLDTNLQKALALFLFSFHARGMSFVDMAFLKKENLKGDRLTYFRKKTGQLLEVRLNEPMKQLLRHFSDAPESPYLLPVITDPARGRLQYETALHTQNQRLRKLAGLAGVSKVVTTHVARHSWATIAKAQRFSTAVISEGLGHSSERTTQKYLASFDRSVVDHASDVVSRTINYRC